MASASQIRPRLWPCLAAVLVTASLWLVPAPAHAQAELSKAISAYRSGDYPVAFKRFSALAKRGNPVAQYNLGVMYLNGRGVEKDTVTAAAWHRMAAERGLATAQYGLGVMYHRGQGVTQNYPAAARWFRKAANQGYLDAQFNLGVMYFNGKGVKRDMNEVIKWISLASAKGHKDAMFRMATMYQNGEPFRRDRTEALRWYKKAAKRGHRQAAARASELTVQLVRQNTGESGTTKTVRATSAATALAAGSTAIKTTPSTGGARRKNASRAAKAANVEIRTATAGRQTKTRKTKKATTTVATRAGDGAQWRVQLASYRTVGEARRKWANLKKRHGDLLRGLTPAFTRVDIPGKGIYHRLRVGPLRDGAAARALCSDLQSKSPKIGCITVRTARR